MGRPIRIRGEGISYHVVARCNNDEFLFKSADDFNLYLTCLAKGLERFHFELNNYTLMSNHVHLMVTTVGDGIDRLIHYVHTTFSKNYNLYHNRKGHFWRDRYKSPIIRDEQYGLACMRYIHRNPMRAGMVQSPEAWPWSAYRFYAFGEPNLLITPFPSYLGLSDNSEERQKMYRRIVMTPSDRENDEKKIFSGKMKWNSQRFCQLYQKSVLPVLLQKVPGTF